MKEFSLQEDISFLSEYIYIYKEVENSSRPLCNFIHLEKRRLKVFPDNPGCNDVLKLLLQKVF